MAIEDIRILVKQLFDKGFQQVACDFWYCCCLGLRKKELLRVKLRSSNGVFFDAINVFEKKNRHHCLRPVPMSLKLMVKALGVDYPFSSERIEVMQKIASQMNRRFYGYRSICITELISAFSATAFRTHHSSRVTGRHYLNTSSLSFIDNFFQLELPLTESSIPPSGLYLH